MIANLQYGTILLSFSQVSSRRHALLHCYHSYQPTRGSLTRFIHRVLVIFLLSVEKGRYRPFFCLLSSFWLKRPSSSFCSVGIVSFWFLEWMASHSAVFRLGSQVVIVVCSREKWLIFSPARGWMIHAQHSGNEPRDNPLSPYPACLSTCSTRKYPPTVFNMNVTTNRKPNPNQKFQARGLKKCDTTRLQPKSTRSLSMVSSYY